jgi:hypothetical protein
MAGALEEAVSFFSVAKRSETTAALTSIITHFLSMKIPFMVNLYNKYNLNFKKCKFFLKKF